MRLVVFDFLGNLVYMGPPDGFVPHATDVDAKDAVRELKVGERTMLGAYRDDAGVKHPGLYLYGVEDQAITIPMPALYFYSQCPQCRLRIEVTVADGGAAIREHDANPVPYVRACPACGDPIPCDDEDQALNSR